jgi:GMP synthase (glutamine-hydrolysing)
VRALAIVHQADAGPGVFAGAVEARGWGLSMWSPPTQPAPPDAPGYDAVMVFGGAVDPDQDREHPWLADERALLASLVEEEMPILAVCLGAELLAQAAGGEAPRTEPEIGWREIALTDTGGKDPLLAPIVEPFDAFQWHSFESAPPAEAARLATSDGRLAAYRVGERAWGIQFHAEVTRDDAARWIRDYRTDPDAVRIGIDPEALLADTEARIEASNALGVAICDRFLEIAAGRTG